MYQLVETIKIFDGEIFNLKYHRKRFQYSFERYYGRKPTMEFGSNIHIPEKFRQGLVKLRYMYNENAFKLEFSFYKKRRIRTLKTVIADHINYEIKYIDRKQIELLYKERGKADDILLIKNGLVTDSSYANIVFNDGCHWITPLPPLLYGTCRSRLLEEGVIKEDMIRVDDLYKFKGFCLINAMNCDLNDILPTHNILL